MSNPISQSKAQSAFWAGARDILPVLFGAVPFGLIYGVIVNSAGFSGLLGQAMSTIIFAGSAQLITAQLFGSAIPIVIIIATSAILNLRHLLYSASLAPWLQELSRGWKFLLSYFLTDEAFAVVITKFEREQHLSPHYRAWYFLGTGLVLWITWHISTGVGIFIGGQIPASWGLDFSVPLTFLALVVPALRDRAGFVTMVVAGVAAVVLVALPLKLGLLAAICLGIGSGVVVDSLQNRQNGERGR